MPHTPRDDQRLSGRKGHVPRGLFVLEHDGDIPREEKEKLVAVEVTFGTKRRWYVLIQRPCRIQPANSSTACYSHGDTNPVSVTRQLRTPAMVEAMSASDGCT